MKILVLGGTGAMGVHLVHMLEQMGGEVFVTSRSPRTSLGNISYIQGNAHDLDFLKEILCKHKWDVVADFMAYSTAEFAERVEMLLAATKQYIFLSSARVFASSDSPIVEDSPRLLDTVKDADYLSTDEYALAKARQENLLKASGKNWTIIRPYITYDTHRMQLGVMEKEAWLYRAMQGRSIVVAKELLSRYTTLTYGRDVAECMAGLIGQETALSQTFNITDSRAVKWSDVLEVYVSVLSEIVGRQVQVRVVDDSLYAKYGARYQVLYDRYYDRVFDNSKIKNATSKQSFIAYNEGLKECMQHFVKQPHFGAIHWAMEGRKDRIAGEFTSLREIKGVKNKMKYLVSRFFNK